jgi:hypothetical protein
VVTGQSPKLGLGPHVDDLVATATGNAHRDDPVSPRTGGPAGNALLTAWLGIALLLLFLVEGVTLASMHQLIAVHILVGGALVAVTGAKTATTGWRILRYYTGDSQYVRAGPPPLVLRLLGPLLIATALAVLGTGLALVAVGSSSSFEPLFAVGGFSVSALTLHQVAFILWLVVTVVHVLARTIPAVKLVTRRSGRGSAAPGRLMRLGALLAIAVAGVGFAVLAVHFAGSWTHQWAHDQW